MKGERYYFEQIRSSVSSFYWVGRMLQKVGDDILSCSDYSDFSFSSKDFVFDENIRYTELELITRVVPDITMT